MLLDVLKITDVFWCEVILASIFLCTISPCILRVRKKLIESLDVIQVSVFFFLKRHHLSAVIS